jgi:hypothetical protein
MDFEDIVPPNHTFSLIFMIYLNLATQLRVVFSNNLKLSKFTNFSVIFYVMEFVS